MAYGRRSTRRTARRSYSTSRRTTYRRAPVRRRVSARRVRKSRAAPRRQQTVRLVIQTAPMNEPQARPSTLAMLGMENPTQKKKTARIGSNG